MSFHASRAPAYESMTCHRAFEEAITRTYLRTSESGGALAMMTPRWRHLTEGQWDQGWVVFPSVKPQWKWGRPRADDRRCLEGAFFGVQGSPPGVKAVAALARGPLADGQGRTASVPRAWP